MTESSLLRIARKLPLAIALGALAVPAAQAARKTHTQPQAAVAAEQTCAPLEVLFSSGAQSSAYALNCRAGDWTLAYSGVLPQGLSDVKATYVVRANNQHGASGTLTRSVEIKNPALIAQVLRTQAVMLADGSLGMRKGNSYVSEIAAGSRVGSAPAPAARGAGELALRAFDDRGDAPRPAAEHIKDETAASLSATKELLARANAEVQSLQTERDGLRSQVASLSTQLADTKAQLATAQGAIADLKKSLARTPAANRTDRQTAQANVPAQALPVSTEPAATKTTDKPAKTQGSLTSSSIKVENSQPVDTQVINVNGRPAITIRTYR